MQILNQIVVAGLVLGITAMITLVLFPLLGPFGVLAGLFALLVALVVLVTRIGKRIASIQSDQEIEFLELLDQKMPMIGTSAELSIFDFSDKPQKAGAMRGNDKAAARALIG